MAEQAVVTWLQLVELVGVVGVELAANQVVLAWLIQAAVVAVLPIRGRELQVQAPLA